MLTVEGWGHATILKSQCADGLITAYLVDRQAPADGARCQQDRRPFDPLPTAKAAQKVPAEAYAALQRWSALRS